MHPGRRDASDTPAGIVYKIIFSAALKSEGRKREIGGGESADMTHDWDWFFFRR